MKKSCAVLCLILALMWSCHPSGHKGRRKTALALSGEAVGSSFKEIIAEATTGRVSVKARIAVRFVKEVPGAASGGIVNPKILTFTPPADRARFETQAAAIEIRLSDNQALSWKPKPGAVPPGVIDMLPYLKLKLLAESVGDPRHVHFANVAGLQEIIRESAL